MVDDLNGIANLAEMYGIHFHVDAAYGGPFVLSRKRDLFKGIERADSMAIDPHKLLYTPYAAGAFLVRDKEEHALIQKTARYLCPKDNEGVLGRREDRNFGFAARVEGSMSSQGVLSTWATKELLGNEGIATVLNNTLDLTDHAHEVVGDSKLLKPLHEPHINTLLVGIEGVDDMPVKQQSKLVEKVQQEVDKRYGYYISYNGEVDNGRSAFRFVAMHPFSRRKDVDGLFEVLEREVSRKFS